MVANPLQLGIPHRQDMEYARSLVALTLNATQALEKALWTHSGYCEAPSVQVSRLTSPPSFES
jgi:hypothetical protein